MIAGELAKALGSGIKIWVGSPSVADGGTVDTGLTEVLGAVVSSSNDAHIAAITGISGGTITIGLADNAGTAITTAEPVYVIAVGKH